MTIKDSCLGRSICTCICNLVLSLTNNTVIDTYSLFVNVFELSSVGRVLIEYRLTEPYIFVLNRSS